MNFLAVLIAFLLISRSMQQDTTLRIPSSIVQKCSGNRTLTAQQKSWTDWHSGTVEYVALEQAGRNAANKLVQRKFIAITCVAYEMLKNAFPGVEYEHVPSNVIFTGKTERSNIRRGVPPPAMPSATRSWGYKVDVPNAVVKVTVLQAPYICKSKSGTRCNSQIKVLCPDIYTTVFDSMQSINLNETTRTRCYAQLEARGLARDTPGDVSISSARAAANVGLPQIRPKEKANTARLSSTDVFTNGLFGADWVSDKFDVVGDGYVASLSPTNQCTSPSRGIISDNYVNIVMGANGLSVEAKDKGLCVLSNNSFGGNFCPYSLDAVVNAPFGSGALAECIPDNTTGGCNNNDVIVIKGERFANNLTVVISVAQSQCTESENNLGLCDVQPSTYNECYYTNSSVNSENYCEGYFCSSIIISDANIEIRPNVDIDGFLDYYRFQYIKNDTIGSISTAMFEYYPVTTAYGGGQMGDGVVCQQNAGMLLAVNDCFKACNITTFFDTVSLGTCKGNIKVFGRTFASTECATLLGNYKLTALGVGYSVNSHDNGLFIDLVDVNIGTYVADNSTNYTTASTIYGSASNLQATSFRRDVPYDDLTRNIDYSLGLQPRPGYCMLNASNFFAGTSGSNDFANTPSQYLQQLLVALNTRNIQEKAEVVQNAISRLAVAASIETPAANLTTIVLSLAAVLGAVLGFKIVENIDQSINRAILYADSAGNTYIAKHAEGLLSRTFRTYRIYAVIVITTVTALSSVGALAYQLYSSSNTTYTLEIPGYLEFPDAGYGSGSIIYEVISVSYKAAPKFIVAGIVISVVAVVLVLTWICTIFLMIRKHRRERESILEPRAKV